MDEPIEVKKGLSVSVEIAMKSYFSIQYLRSADLFIKKASEIETKDPNDISEENRLEYQSYCYSAILLSAAFLEATINEFLIDISENLKWSVASKPDEIVDPQFQKLIHDLWAMGIPRTAQYSIIQKYQIALTLAGKEEISENDDAYRNAFLLKTLRNDLIHAESEWIHDDLKKNSKKYRKYVNNFCGKFSLNPFKGEGNPFFPDRCIGFGCAKWSLISATEFTDLFFQRIGFTPKYYFLRERIIH